MPDRTGIVVIGAGQAAVQLAISLRHKGVNRPITLFGDEVHPPYRRPPLSKRFLKGDTPLESLYFRQKEWFQQNDIHLRVESRVEAIDRERKTVRLANEEVRYGDLILATGTRPRILPDLHPSLPNVLYLRGIDDVQKAMTLLPDSSSVAVIGGGFIGLEFASVMRGLDRDVTVVESAPRLLSRAVSPMMSDWFLSLHQRHGVDVRLSARLKEVVKGGDGQVLAIRLEDGSLISADLIVVGIGVVPNDDLAAAAGTDTDNGVRVDARLRTSDPNIYAIGDCCSFPLRDGRHVRLESVQNAVDQAKHLAACLAGQPTPYAAVPWFWTDQFDTKLQIAGLPGSYDEARIVGDQGAPSYSIEYLRDKRLVAVDSLNDARTHIAARKLLAVEMGAAAA